MAHQEASIINNQMSSSLRFSNRDRNSKKYLQPPALNSFDLFSSQDREERFDEQIQELSNVEEKSYFESEPELPDQLDIQDFLGRIKEIDEKELTPSASPKRSRRLEEQEIIVVEEESEVGSNAAGKESVILEHIQFAHEEHHEDTPEWEIEEKGVNGEEMRYVINCISENSPAWIARDNQSLSSSTPYDIEGSQFRISRNRHSKNTCIERAEQSDNDKHPANKSCIEKPISFQEHETMAGNSRFPSTSLQKSKSKNIQDILNKWNEEIYPRLQSQYRESEANVVRRVSADLRIERDAKFCQSKYKEQLSQGNTSRISRVDDVQSFLEREKSRTSKMMAQDQQTQTELSGGEILQNEKYLTEEIAQLRSRNLKMQDELLKLKEKMADEHSELTRQQQTLRLKDLQLQEQAELARKEQQQCRRLQARNKELQRVVNKQGQQLKYYGQKNEELAKKLHKTVSYSMKAQGNSPTFFGGEQKPARIGKLQTFGLEENVHSECKRQVEELQQCVFDLRQKIAGIDIEVERRVMLITDSIEREMQKKVADQGRRATSRLKQELSKYKQAYKMLEAKLKDYEEKHQGKEQELNEREKQINRMYDQLIKQWNQAERQTQIDKKHPATSQLKAKHLYSPKAAAKDRLDYATTSTKRQENPFYHLSNRQIKTPNYSRERLEITKRNAENANSFSYIPHEDAIFRKGSNKLNQTEKLSYNIAKILGEQNKWERRELSSVEIREKSELTAINNKIQRLRKEINKQLCSIH